MSTATVPMSSPATVSKNGDGTYTVRVQHTVEGSVTEVNFTNPVFGEALAEAYAAMLNGSAKLDAVLAKTASDVEAALPDLKADAKKALAEAQKSAATLLDAAKLEAQEIKAEAHALFEETKNEAEKLLDDAKTEAAKLLHAAAAKIEPTPATPTAAPAAKSSLDEE
jgi:dsDNA-specific endonuclease/ATPase MutS2